ncbi:hypothetical protein Tco_0925182 [Tanacetum coccineum]|uniref:Uncharacterized protein n=1 Tax=Tanacetum coccineum TaxID=301880 RepID=A0ABQ5D6Y9_9ASTR
MHEQYIQMIDYALWEVIENGNSLPKTQLVNNVMTLMPLTITEEKAQKRLEMKARSTLMMSIPNEHQLKLQKLVSQLELLDEKLSQEDVNQKLLRCLSREWNTHAGLWRNKANLDTMSMDDLYTTTMKTITPKIKGILATIQAHTTTNGAVNTTQEINTAHGVSTASTQVNDVNSTNIDNLSDFVICAFFASQPNSPQLVHDDLQQIYPDDMKEMDLRWKMAMLTMRAKRFLKNIGRKLTVKGNETCVLIRSKVSAYQLPTKVKVMSCGYDWSDQAKKGPNYALMAFSSDSEMRIVKACLVKKNLMVVTKNDDASIIKELGTNDEEEEVTKA